MNSILQPILNNEVQALGIAEFIDEKDITKLLKIAKSIQKDKLYSSQIHGFYHSEKVMLFSYIIGKSLNLSDEDFQILMDAAVYHDMQRENDFEDAFHGFASARKIHTAIKDKIYENQENLNILRAIVDLHSQNDKKSEINFDNYELHPESKNRYEILYKILKDADALDRMRFSEKCAATLNPDFLRFDISKKMISLSQKINARYYEIIEERQQEHNVDHTKKGACFHGIGFDFFRLPSILNYGILSAGEMKKRNLLVPRNFDGGNVNKWISVVDASLIRFEYTGYKNFTQHGINFFCEVPEMIKPVSSERQTDAIVNGLPFDKSGHLDERYVYKKIDTENILCVIVPQKYIKTDIRDLNYLYNSLSFEMFMEKIKYYLDHFLQAGINVFELEKCSWTDFENLLALYKKEIDNYVLNTDEEKKKSYNTIPKRLNSILEKINHYIQLGMHEYYKKKTGKEEVDVLTVVTAELQASKCNYNLVVGDCEAMFMLDPMLKGQIKENTSTRR